MMLLRMNTFPCEASPDVASIFRPYWFPDDSFWMKLFVSALVRLNPEPPELPDALFRRNVFRFAPQIVMPPPPFRKTLSETMLRSLPAVTFIPDHPPFLTAFLENVLALLKLSTCRL